MGTPLNVTFEPGSIDRPERLDSTVSWVFASNTPRNCIQVNASTATSTMAMPAHALLYGGSYRQCLNRC
ncbi:Uncharacterised protein [Mycolicibacterium fortuitum]|uniref:Uncharacterized protein n=1 Tax=Mycolicibacterium fortuitum TaxID=1766 RepID=A0A378V040_MYCFO|nr:Uncharacterised protein [Mycolicibacterium fortuitum]